MIDNGDVIKGMAKWHTYNLNACQGSY